MNNWIRKYLTPELGFTEAFVQSNFVIAFDKANPKLGGNEVLGGSFHFFNDVVAIYDSLYMLSNGSIRSCGREVDKSSGYLKTTRTNAIFIHQGYKIGFRQ